MENYTIYCTEEQTKKALELGAPIKRADILDDLKNQRYFFCNYGKIGAIVPTAEQMIGWLETQGDINTIEVKRAYKWSYSIFCKDHWEIMKHNIVYKTRKEATLAAIDVALDYLANSSKKEE